MAGMEGMGGGREWNGWMGVSRELPLGAPLQSGLVGIYRLLLSMSAGAVWMMIDTSSEPCCWPGQVPVSETIEARTAAWDGRACE